MSGSTIPFELYPVPLQKALTVIPLTHGIKLLKMSSLGVESGDPLTHVLVLTGVTITGAVVALLSFRWE